MATEVPVILVVTVAPETPDMTVGASLRTKLTILSVATKLPVDPDSTYPRLVVTPPFTSPTTYQYGTGSTIVKDSTGVYYADLPIAKAGKNSHQWLVTMGAVSVGSNVTELQGVLAGYW